jgi:hypothetical protein
MIDAESHLDWRPWLLAACFDHVCAYCGTQNRVIQVDHVEPESWATLRVKDPENLLPSCGTCNGAAGKWDYHPLHVGRRRLRKDSSGHLPLDPRQDDYGALYIVHADGRISPRPGPQAARASWNSSVLLRLDRSSLITARKEILRLRDAAESLLLQWTNEGRDPWRLVWPDPVVEAAPLSAILDCLARRLLFLELFDLQISAELHRIARARRNVLRGAESGSYA